MSDLLVKNIEIPKSCYSEIYSEQGNCWFFFYDFNGGCHCSISDCKCLKTKRPKGCPLVEVPPHGRLTDADEVLNKVTNGIYPDSMEYTIAVGIIEREIKEAPTVLEASR